MDFSEMIENDNRIPVLYEWLDHTPGTDLMWSLESLPKAAQLFFVLRKPRMEISILSTEESRRLGQMIESIKIGLDIEVIDDPMELMLNAAKEAERVVSTSVAHEGLTLFVAAVSGVAAYCKNIGWTYNKYEIRFKKSGILNSLTTEDESEDHWYYLHMAMRKSGGCPWHSRTAWKQKEPLVKGAVVRINNVDMVLVTEDQFSKEFYGFLKDEWWKLPVKKRYSGEWSKEELNECASFYLHKTKNDHWCIARIEEPNNNVPIVTAEWIGRWTDIWH